LSEERFTLADPEPAYRATAQAFERSADGGVSRGEFNLHNSHS